MWYLTQWENVANALKITLVDFDLYLLYKK